MYIALSTAAIIFGGGQYRRAHAPTCCGIGSGRAQTPPRARCTGGGGGGDESDERPAGGCEHGEGDREVKMCLAPQGVLSLVHVGTTMNSTSSQHAGRARANFHLSFKS